MLSIPGYKENIVSFFLLFRFLVVFKALKMGIIFGILIDDEVSWWLIEFIGIKT